MAQRKPGDPIPGSLVKEMRLKAGMTQDQFAKNIGVRGGKSVISAWENGASSCDGPASELLLYLYGDRDASFAFNDLFGGMDDVWNRAGNYSPEWRQFSAVPKSNLEISREYFTSVIPEAAIPPDEYAHGFPFGPPDLPPNVVGLTQERWIGSIPVERDRPPKFLWTLQRNARFAYREFTWEANQHHTQGHTHINSLFKLCLAGTCFLKRFFEHCKLKDDLQFVIRLDMNGMFDRGITLNPLHGFSIPREQRTRFSAENQISVQQVTSVSEIMSDPIEKGMSLVGEVLLIFRPDHASNSKMRKLLESAVQMDKEEKYRWLGFVGLDWLE